MRVQGGQICWRLTQGGLLGGGLAFHVIKVNASSIYQ
jgi:hypothetical protein